jgi:2-hydroxychromene-2-carboxylate isomerase
MPGSLDVTLFTDPGCPWAYSGNPPLAVMRWRYGDQLSWRLVMIGLTENPEQYVARGYTPTWASVGQLMFRDRYGMPFAVEPRERVLATTRGCRTVIATRLLAPGRELAVLRALQFAWFTTTLLLDRDEDIAKAIEWVPGIDAKAIVATLDDPAVLAGYEADKRETRTAGGRPIDFQGKARQTDGPVRYSAPSLIFRSGERDIEAGGFQPVEAYDLAVANLDTTLERQPPPESPLPPLQSFPDGLTTQEVAAVMAPNNTPPDRTAAEAALVELVGAGTVRRMPLGGDALWLAA